MQSLDPTAADNALSADGRRADAAEKYVAARESGANDVERQSRASGPRRAVGWLADEGAWARGPDRGWR